MTLTLTLSSNDQTYTTTVDLGDEPRMPVAGLKIVNPALATLLNQAIEARVAPSVAPVKKLAPVEKAKARKKAKR